MKHTRLAAAWQSTDLRFDRMVYGGVAEEDASADVDPWIPRLHEGPLPPNLRDALTALYGRLYASLDVLEAYGSLPADVRWFSLHRGSRLQALFLYALEGTQARVLGEGMPVEPEHVAWFASSVWQRHPQVDHLLLSDVEWRGSQVQPPGPSQCYRHLENVVVDLPSDVQSHRSALGKNTRRNLKRYGERLQRDFPDFRYEIFAGDHVEATHLKAVIGLNVERMQGKHRRSAYLDEREADVLCRLMRRCGLLLLARAKDEICAGAVLYRTGDALTMSVLAHDPRYNDYSLGFLCAERAIELAIETGAREFHFLWGRYDYKFQLGGRERALMNLVLYRDRWAALRHPFTLARHAWERQRRRLSEDLRDGDRPLAKAWMRLQPLLRRLRPFVREGL